LKSTNKCIEKLLVVMHNDVLDGYVCEKVYGGFKGWRAKGLSDSWQPACSLRGVAEVCMQVAICYL